MYKLLYRAYSPRMGSSSSVPDGNAETRLRAELEEARAALEQLTAERQGLERETIQRERRMLAQTLHDTVSQSLTGVYLQAQVIAKKMQKDTCNGVQEVSALVETIHSTVLELSSVTRGLQSDKYLSVAVPTSLEVLQ